jgi:hypothetical protein
MAVTIIPGINHLAQTIRETGGLVVWTRTTARTSSSVDAAFNDDACFGERGAKAFYECHSPAGFLECPLTGPVQFCSAAKRQVNAGLVTHFGSAD